jgi:hypothetical protein
VDYVPGNDNPADIFTKRSHIRSILICWIYSEFRWTSKLLVIWFLKDEGFSKYTGHSPLKDSCKLFTLTVIPNGFPCVIEEKGTEECYNIGGK